MDQAATGTAAGGVATPEAEQDIEVLNQYLIACCVTLLDVDKDLFYKEIHTPESQKTIKNFAVERGQKSLVVSKSERESPAIEGSAPPDGAAEKLPAQVTIEFSLEVAYKGPNTLAIAFLKREQYPTLDLSVHDLAKHVAVQLQVINVGYIGEDNTPFVITNTYILNSLTPLFQSYEAVRYPKDAVDEEERKKSSGSSGLSKVHAKLNELSLAILQCQQNLEIPDVQLVVDPEVRNIVKRAKAENRKVMPSDYAEEIKSNEFLQGLQFRVNQWIKDIRKVTKLERDPSTGSALQEVNFWLNLERVLLHIKEQIEQPEITTTLDILHNARRFYAVVSFGKDIELDNAINRVNGCNMLMRNFPINGLISATTIEQIGKAIDDIFERLKKSFKGMECQYPADRYIAFIEAISRDLTAQMVKVLSGMKIMELEFSKFEKILSKDSQEGVFVEWQRKLKDFREGMRQLSQRRGERMTIKTFSMEHEALQKRLTLLLAFRSQHHKLQEVIRKVLRKGKEDDDGDAASKAINQAYNIFLNFDVLDYKDTASWDAARKNYDDKIEKIENEIIKQLKDKLVSCSNANEMFKVFNKFNALFVRPKIRAAIQEYQAKLLETVRKDIEALREKFLSDKQMSTIMSKLRDIPQVSGKIIWVRQIERRLSIYMERVKDVLGPTWDQHIDGKNLKDLGEQFKRFLNMQDRVEAWQGEVVNITLLDVQASHTIFNVVQKKDKYELVVNFDEKATTLFKEVRNLAQLGFRIGFLTKSKATNAKDIYPKAVSLQEIIKTFYQTNLMIDDRVGKLVAKIRSEMQNNLRDCLKYTWSIRDELNRKIPVLTEKVSRYEEAVMDVKGKFDLIQQNVQNMAVCTYDAHEFNTYIAAIQKSIDAFTLQEYSNVSIIAAEIDSKIEQTLTKRLAEIVPKWLSEFIKYDEEGGVLITVATVHEIKMEDQSIFLEPPIAEARAYWFKEFHKLVEVVCGLPRIESERFEKAKGGDENQDNTYRAIMEKLASDVLLKACTQIEDILRESEEYARSWIKYQALWDLDSTKIFEKLGDDIDRWQLLLTEIKNERGTFDSSMNEKHFGPLVIDYRSVQSKISNKYDNWHKEILKKFADTMHDNMKSFYQNISSARSHLEAQNLDINSSDVTLFVTEIQELKKKVSVWQESMDRYKNGRKLLDRHRYQYPIDSLQVEQVEGEWSSLRQILGKKSKTMEDQIPILQAKILSEEKSLNQKLEEVETLWKDQRPDQGDLLPTAAIKILNDLEQKLGKLKTDGVKVCKAKELLEMEPGSIDRILTLEEDMSGLKGVWTELNEVWKIIEAMRGVHMTDLVPKTMKENIDTALVKMDEFPNKLRQYEAFDNMKSRVAKYKKEYVHMSELKSEAMKPRHWKILLSKLKIRAPASEVTVGMLWDVDLIKNDAIVKEVMSQARGELILEEFLRTIKEYWSGFDLDLVMYQNKCKLIRGWAELTEKIDEHINNLASMKISPYYKVFEEEIAPWDEKLQRLHIIFDVWIDLQRSWVYLQGIFFGSADIKNQLQNEYTKFKNIDNEFMALMKKVSQRPNVLEVAGIPNLQRNLEKLTEQLNKIQKALGDYLEMQRGRFARFYFVGDEDLLEIIGNSKDVTNVQRHFPKMFAGVTVIKSENNGDLLVGMSSREGEHVNFTAGVKISDDPTINVWLTKLENEMRMCLAAHLDKAVNEIASIDREAETSRFLEWIEQYPAQIVLLSMQVFWSTIVEQGVERQGGKELSWVEELTIKTLVILADRVLTNLTKDIRQKYEQLITDFVHQRDVTRQLMAAEVTDVKDFTWLYHMRFYWFPKEPDPLKKLHIKMAQGNFNYGFEYLGVGEKLVQTPLTDRCYLTLTQAIHYRMGGNPFGPAGTGKTESVKALGAQMGRFVLVFNCDETFDFQAMGRIFVGLCQVGAWGCFDEFNRLEEKMLSAVSQQILTIQTGLREQVQKIDLMGKDVRINSMMGIFVTMNPGYAGRSNLPDNLKQLFRQMAMVKPDKDLIAQVMLYSQGFKSAERLSGKIVSLFDLCANQLSSQPHYDFGLRALKSVLVSAGNLKRAEKKELSDINEINEWEQKVLLKSVCDTVVPKLVSEDIPLLSSLLSGVFPGSDIIQMQDQKLRDMLELMCAKYNVVPNTHFIEKVMQLDQIIRLHHGVMMVGPSGSGKSVAWKILLECLTKIDGIKGEGYIVDPKAVTKDELYGKLDNTTLEWTDGIFTHILRTILNNVRGESNKRHWIIFDGDVDPEWAENLNSVLDDNKLLTLPSGDRLSIPPNVRIMFEVESLKNATLATVSRCGMVWFSNDVVSQEMMFEHYLRRLKQDEYDSLGADPTEEKEKKRDDDPLSIVRRQCVECIRPLFEGTDSFVSKSVNYAETLPHVMEFTKVRVLEAMFALIRKGISNILEYNESHPDFPMTKEQIEAYMTKWVVHCVMWGVGGAMSLRNRWEFGKRLVEFTDLPLPDQSVAPLIDYEVLIDDQQWSLWKKKVPTIDIDPQKVVEADVIITTVDTLRHQDTLCSWLSEHRPFLLCGPPGSGKTMTLMATLKSLPDFEMIFVNFSSSTTPTLLLKTFNHYCEYKKTPNGTVLRPRNANKWLVVFCDEINLPEIDKYGTQAIITFLRQLTEQKGFWRPSDKTWIKLEKIQFVGACNPPTDAGRHPLSNRFLRHAPLILVDFPGPESLRQIYGTFNRAMLKRVPALKNYADPLTNTMVDFYTESQQHFTADMQPHYIYSPRELTRWKYAIFEALDSVTSPEELARLVVHEGLRLFQDRLVHQDEKEWTDKKLDEVVMNNFPGVDDKALERPILFTNYLTKNYISVERERLRDYINARLKVFYEEELNVPIVVFDSVLDHILRIDRVLRQPIGHMLLVGASGVGKTTLSRFVSWMNNISVFQIKAGRNYSVLDFDEDLRSVMKRAGVKQEKICFVFDESNVLSAAFLERMNALLASGEVPGLFDGDEYNSLINQCREAYQKEKEGKLIDSEEDLYKLFINYVQRNLHVVFTMNPANPDFSNRTASSPALFNRCVIDWFGDWSEEALFQVAKEFTKTMELPELGFSERVRSDWSRGEDVEDAKHNILVGAIVRIHNSIRDLNTKMAKSAKKYNFITPRDFLDFIRHFVELQAEKKEELQEQQHHLNVGLAKLKETEEEVKVLQISLDKSQKELETKQKQANQKLQMMLQEQKQAEAKKEASLVTGKQLALKQEEIKKRSEEAQTKLARAEPALREAEKSVGSISTKHLNELRAMPNPPPMVKKTMEPVIMMLRQAVKIPTWPEVRAELRKEDFIQSITSFDRNSITEPVKKAIKDGYLDTADWDLGKIDRASKAAGPLAKWLTSIIDYAEILISLTPLRNEVAELQAQEKSMREEYEQVQKLIKELEGNIAQLQADYEVLIAETQSIKSEMSKVAEKVKRSQDLIRNLSSERTRWDESSQGFKDQMATLVGDTLIAGAFLSYIGFFDHYYRKILHESWKEYLDMCGIRCKPDLALIEFLSKPDDRLTWNLHSLPTDDLCTENAIILSKFNRYPLIIDPSGQALEFIVKHYENKKLIKTSFADEAFMKNLESALRFGCPLLVQDVEKIEPILNSVLNKELHKTGGRILIRVGDQEIDFSDTFKMFMVTRDSQATFTPDLCSRVTFVNFTVTPSSLQEQCLNIYLKSERAEVDKKRSDLLKIQGEFKVKLRKLEDSLLDALNNVTGNILENDEVLATLENLKKQAAEVQKEIDMSDEVMKEIEVVSNQYLPLAVATARIFFCLESMSAIHFLYQYSLQAFMEIIYYVLNKNPIVTEIPKSESDKRRVVISEELFVTIYHRFGLGLLNQHKMLFALRLTQIKLGHRCENELSLLLKGGVLFKEQQLPSSFMDGLFTNNQIKAVEELNDKDIFKGLVDHMNGNKSDWVAFFKDNYPENKIPECWNREVSYKDPEDEPIAKALKRLIVLKTLRPDRFTHGAQEYVNLVLGEKFLKIPEVDLVRTVEKESNCHSPLLLCSAPGYDASFKVDHLAKTMNKKYQSVAIGSAEGFNMADKSIDSAVKTGTWVLLKNVHLAPQWLVELEKKLHRIKPNDNFRLFLTMEIHPKVPRTLVRMSQVFVFEPPAGIKASLQRTYTTVLDTARSDKSPVERSRLHFLLSWFHAIVQERLRYTPIGWSKQYEFNESDQRGSLDTIDEWINDVSKDMPNIDPDKVPWEAMKTLICQSLYGGKIDNDFDYKILLSLADQFFRIESFNLNFALFAVPASDSSNKVLTLPDIRKASGYVDWVEALPSIESPIWSGLPANVEKILKEKDTLAMIANLRELQGVGEDEIMEGKEGKGTEERSSWLAELQVKCEKLLELLPANLEMLPRTATSISNPLFRFLEREITVAGHLLDTVRDDLGKLKEMCLGNIKSTNALREIAKSLYAEVIPGKWKVYSVADTTATEWVLDFKQRLDQFKHLAKQSDYGRKGIWLGGLLYPEAFLTATRQAVSQDHKWSLEELDLHLSIGVKEPENDQCFILQNTAIEGAQWDGASGKIVVGENLSYSLPSIMIKWVHKTESAKASKDLLQVPVYLNNSRSKLLFSVKLSAGEMPHYLWYQRGIALISWNKS